MSHKVIFPVLLGGITLGLHEILSYFKVKNIIYNEGVSFGLNFPLADILIILFLIIIFWFYIKEKSLFLLMIMIGGIVNLLDRIRFGSVRDYWRIFDSSIYNNVNDWLIFLGALLFLTVSLWKKKLK